MGKQKIFEKLKKEFQTGADFKKFLESKVEFEGRKWTAGQFLYKYFFDEIQSFNNAVSKGEVPAEDAVLAEKIKKIIEYKDRDNKKGLVNPTDVYDLTEAGKLPNLNMFDDDGQREDFYRKLFCSHRSQDDSLCYWTPVSQYYTRFVEHRLSQMGMTQEQIETLMIHCENEREKAEVLAIQNMPVQFVHVSRCPPDKIKRSAIQPKPRTDDNFLNLQKYCFVGEPNTFHPGLPIQDETEFLSWPRFNPKIMAFQLTPEKAEQCFQDAYIYEIDMSQKDSIKPVIPLWGGYPTEWVSTKALSYVKTETETIQKLLNQGMELYLIPKKEFWDQNIAGRDSLSEDEARKYMNALFKQNPTQIIKMSEDKKINLKLPQQIESERIILKKHSLDKEYIQQLVDSINECRGWLGKFLPHFEEKVTFENEKAFIKEVLSEEKEINYAIWDKKTNALMGTIGVFNPDNPKNPKSIEIAIMLFEEFAGQHYGPEAIETLENVLFQNGVEKVFLKIQKENTRSRKAAEAKGHTWNGEIATTDEPNLQMLIYKKFSDSKRR